VYKREYTNAKLLLWNKTCQLIFDNTRRYARLVLSSNDTLNIAKDGYEYVQTNVTFYTTRFSSQLYVDFNVTHVYMPNIFKKLMRVVAYEPYKVGDRIGFRIDENMRIKMMITPANASLTYPELLMMMAENEKSDETALQYFQNDLYNYKNATQIFDAMGELDAVINKTAVIDLYNYMIIIQNPNTNIETHDTTILLFDNETVNVYVNFIGYGVDVKNVTATPTQVIIRLFVRNEAGGLEWFAIRTQDEVLQNITLPRVPSLINARGFFGDHMITIPKTSSSYFYLEYKNVWNAVTLDGPYSIPQSNVERAEGLPFEYWVGLLFFAYVFARIVGRKLRRG
jgi:Ser-tRNA(Ala) deacylase AlaX